MQSRDIDLSTVDTETLVRELAKREGVDETTVSPEQTVEVCVWNVGADGVNKGLWADYEGPVIVLVVKD